MGVWENAQKRGQKPDRRMVFALGYEALKSRKVSHVKGKEGLAILA
jgi:hypothetical protein